jgi:hypothetical protein
MNRLNFLILNGTSADAPLDWQYIPAGVIGSAIHSK